MTGEGFVPTVPARNDFAKEGAEHARDQRYQRPEVGRASLELGEGSPHAGAGVTPFTMQFTMQKEELDAMNFPDGHFGS